MDQLQTLVRPASFEDTFGIVETVRVARELLDNTWPEEDLPYAYQAVMDQIAKGLVAVVGNSAGVIVGVIILDEARWPWTHPSNKAGYYLYNQHWWVEPSSRKGGAGIRLLDWAIARADEVHLPLMIEMTSLDAGVEEKDAFVRRKGFTRIGGKFFRESAKV
jgi:GNAT superfamily N-acetyltransferase